MFTSNSVSVTRCAHTVVFGSLIAGGAYAYYRYRQIRHRLITSQDELGAAAILAAGDAELEGGGHNDWGEQTWKEQRITERVREYTNANPQATPEQRTAALARIREDVDHEWWQRYRDLENEMPGEVIVVTESEARGERPKKVRLRRIKREQGWRFIRYWVKFGKAEFPSAYRSRMKEADRVCIEYRIRGEMRKRSVRDADIATYLPTVVAAIMTPSAHEVEAERMLVTQTVQRRREEARPLGKLWDVLWGTTGGPPLC